MIERREREGKREEERGREKEREGEKGREREREASRVNYGTRTCKKKEGLFERKILGNYPWIIAENYHLVYHHAEKLRFIGILAYPKMVPYASFKEF